MLALVRTMSSNSCMLAEAWCLTQHSWVYRLRNCSEKYQSDEAIGCESVYAGQVLLLYSCHEPTHPWVVTQGCSILAIVSGVT
jgi:hypothetical protein